MLTNFATIRKAVRKMSTIDKLLNTPSYTSISKRERLQISRERAKLEKNLGSISDLNRLPAAIFVVDISKERIAIAEARRLNIPTFAIVDTNSNPNLVDFPIPANDDAAKSISLIVSKMIEAIEEGLTERKIDKDKRGDDDKDDSDNSGEGRGFDLDDEEDPELKKIAKLKAAEEGDGMKRPRKPAAGKGPVRKSTGGGAGGPKKKF